MADRLLAAKRLEALMEDPLHGVLNWLIEQGRQERHDRQTKANRTPSANRLVLDVLERATAVSYNTVDRKCRQTHTGHALEDTALQHHGAVILKGRNPSGRRLVVLDLGPVAVLVDQTQNALLARRELDVGVQHPRVVPVRLVALVADVAKDVSPRDTVGAADQPRVRNGPEGLADVRGVGHVAVRGHEDGTEAGGVGGVADVGVGRGGSAVVENMANVSAPC